MSSTDIFYAIRFWLVLTAIGAAGLPFAYRLFHQLPDRGYAFSKMTGLVMTTFSFWLISSYGLTSNSVGGIVFGLLIFVGVSVWLYQKTDQKLLAYLKDNIGYLLMVKLNSLFVGNSIPYYLISLKT